MKKLLKKLTTVVVLTTFLLNVSLLKEVYAVDTDGNASNWTMQKAEQLARRALFGATPDNISELYNAGSASAAVDLLFPSVEGPDRTAFDADISSYMAGTGFSLTDSNKMNVFYAYRTLKDPNEAKRKLFGLFEDIFSVDRSGNTTTDITYADVENHFSTLYDETLGNYKTLMKKVLFDTSHPERSFAQGQYLNLLNQADKNSPNENYAREMMQLFLMLEYKPWENADNSGALRNYEESDVASLAKILSGFRSDANKNVYFDNTYHNTGTGIVFLSGALASGDSFSFYNTDSGTIDNTKIIESISGNNGLGDNIVDYIFSKRQNEIADFLAWRMYKYYINDNPTQSEIENIASRLVSNNFEIYPTVKYLLSSDMMYTDKAMNTIRYKTPLELTIGTLKLMHYKNPTVYDNTITSTSLLTLFDFTPYNPRSIFGRPGYDNNSVFFNAYFHNQWFSNIASKLTLTTTSGAYNFPIDDFIGTTRFDETGSINLVSGTSNTYSGNINLSNLNLTLNQNFVIGQQLVEVPVENTSQSTNSGTTTDTGSITDTGSLADSGSLTSSGETTSTGETQSIPQTQSVLQDIVTKDLTFNSGSVNLSSLTINTDTGINLSFDGKFDFANKKVTFNSGSFVYSGSTYTFNSGSAIISSDSVLTRDITTKELFKNIENTLLLGRELPADVKEKLTTYLTTDSLGNKRNFLPNNSSYKNTYLRSLFSLILSQPEFLIQSGYDLAQDSNNSGNSVLTNKQKKLVMIELSGGYDWLNAMIPKEDSEYQNYQNIRASMALSGASLIDVGDYYLNSSYSAYKEFYDAGELKIINRVGTPSHSRAHDTAAIQMTSKNALTTLGTPGLIGDLISGESDPTNNIVLGTSKPSMLTNGKYLNIGGNTLKYSSSSSDKTYQISTLKNILSTRSYPGISSPNFTNSETLDDLGNGSGQTSVGYTLASRLAFTSNLISNNLGVTYYVPGGGGYDTHENELSGSYTLNNRVTDLSNDISTFFKTQKNLGNDVTIVVFSEFGRTLKTNGTLGTDHGQGGGYFILTTDTGLKQAMPNSVYGKLKPSKEKYDWFGVGIDYRAVYSKILTTLYGVDSVGYFAKEYNLEDYINSDTPKPNLLRTYYTNSSYTNNVKVNFTFKFDDKKMILKDGSYVKFYRGTNPNSLSLESQWTIDNYYISKDGIATLPVDGYKGNRYYYRLEFYDNQYDTYSTTGSFLIPDKVTTGTGISLTNDTYFTKYNNTDVTSEKTIEKFSLFNAGTGTNLTTKTFTGGISMIFGTGETSVSTLTSSSGTLKWYGGFELPKFVNKDEFLPTNANFSGTSLSSLGVENIVKVGADSLGVGMKLNQNVLLKVPGFDVSKKYGILTSQDGVNWKSLENQTVVNDSGSLIFSTNHFSYFAFVDASNLDCSLNISPKTVDLGNDYYLNFSSTGANSYIFDNGISTKTSSGSLKVTSTQTGTLTYNYTVSNGFASKTCTDSVLVKPITKTIDLDNSTGDATLTGTTTVGSGFSLIGEEIPSEIFSFSGESISDLVSSDILDKSGSSLAGIQILPETKMYYSSGNLDFNKKYLNDLSFTNSGKIYSFSGIISLGGDETVLLDSPAKITYYNKKSSKIAYKKSTSNTWHFEDTQALECSVTYANPICAYIDGNNTVIKTLHFTDFSTLEVTDVPVVTPPSDGSGTTNSGSTNTGTTTPTKSSSGGGGAAGMTKDYCPTGDNSPSYYDRICDGVSKTSTGSTNSQTNNSTQSLLNGKTLIFKQSNYEIYYIVGYDLSIKTRRLSQYIISSKKLTNEDKALIVKRINEFLVARYNLESADIKTVELQNIYAKASILLKASLNRLKK